MKTKTTYVKFLHLFFFLFLLTNTNSLFSQAALQGYGSSTAGGGGQTVVHVTNLNATGTGSLNAALVSNRTIVFDVGGTISGFKLPSTAFANVTVDGTTAPAPGITLTNTSADIWSMDGTGYHDIIIKNIRTRNAGSTYDGFNCLGGAHHIVFDHCSSSGNGDGNLDMTSGAHDITVQYCILGGGRANDDNYSGTMLIAYAGTNNLSVHHNLIVPATVGGVGERVPFVHSNGTPTRTDLMVDFRNNLVYKWGRDNGTGSGYASGVDYGGSMQCINNYYYSNAAQSSAIDNDADGSAGSNGQCHASGNVSGNTGVNPNNASNHAMWTIPAAGTVTTTDACTAAQVVRAQAGCQPLDAVDQAFVNAVVIANCATSGNQPPVANAGADKTLTLPTNSTSLTGSGTDADGTIASYAWTRVSGPTTFTLGTANAATTTLTNLVQGVYVFRLTVTDNNGATGTDDVTVTVNAATNLAPTANAGSDVTITLPTNTTTLIGSGTDADGTIASYAWSRVSGPTTFTLGSANTATTTLTNLVLGTYVFRLTVTDNNGATGTDNVTVIVVAAPNLAPTANAGSDITLTLPVNNTTLNGSGTDADGTIASYAWARVSGPTTFTIGTANAATTTLSNLVAGTYVFRLTVTDNNGATATDNVTVIVNAPINQPPTANAGSDITLTLPVNNTTLNGSGTDADGTIASYAWARVSGPTTFTIGTANAATTTLSNLVAGIYVFRLTVTDNSGATATDNVTVTVNAAANIPPTANAGNNITITLPTNNTTLVGSGTDADGTIASYAWTRVSGPTTFTIGTANAATTTLTNLAAGTYVFRLTVTDNNGATGTDDVTVTVNAAANQPPTANAGNNITITLPTNSTTLNGSGTDADGTITTYAWTRVSGPTTFTIGTANAATTTLSNLVAGTYVFRLTVTDNNGATATDDVTVTVNAAVNIPPTANAGNNITITLPTNNTTLNGSGADADGTITTYAWTRISGPTTFTLGTANAATTTLTNLVAGTYVFRLTVTDNSGATATDDVTVTVNAAVNIPPTANAGNNITITLPTNNTTLNGSGADADGTITTYAWTRVSGPTTFTLGTANAATTTLTNLVAGTYVFRLTVTDNSGATATDDVIVTVNAAVNIPPTANAGNNITITLPINNTTLNGSGADADGTIATYAWTRVSGPTTFTLGTANAATTTLTNLLQGVYVFRLTVTDNNGATATDDVTVTVNAAAPNQAPTANAGNNITLTLPVNNTTLNGSGADADGTITGYAWTSVSGPATFTMGTANAATTTLTNLIQGVYVFRLTVTDNNGATGTDDVIVTVNAAANIPPTANAGNNITITLPTNNTTLNGSGADADGTITTYAWTRVSGPTNFALGTANSATTTLTGLVQGVYTFRLTVTDNNGATATDDVTVTVNAAANQPPTANAGNNITITLPTNNTSLVGSGTDPDGTIASYAWTRVSGPTTFTLGTANAATTTLTNLVQGVYVFRLTVTDNNGATATDDVTVTVNAATNQAPIAIAGNNITLNLPANSATLNGTASFDPDGTITGYAWTKVSGPNTFTITNGNTSTATLSNLGVGTYVFQLTVTDNSGATDDDNITIIVSATPNLPPTANAGNNITLTLPLNSTNLNGGSSTDADGTIVAYAWTRVSGPTTYTLANAGAAATGLSNLVQGVYVFRLTVTDNSGATSTDDITVTVNAAGNQSPTANAGSDVTITLPVNSTMLTGSGYDPDGTIATYAWTRVSGPATYTIVNAGAAATGLNGLVQGVYVFRLTVTDNSGATATDNVTVTVNAATTPTNLAPTANAGSDITLTLPVNSTILTGSGFDPDGTIATYAWTRVSGPATFTLGTANATTTTLTNLVQGVYVFRLTVTDNNGATGTDVVTVTVNAATNQAPTANAGADITITLPTNTTTLYGSGSDPDGTIAAYAWVRVSGPTAFTLANTSSATTGLYNLVQGVYVFRLTITDNSGATATDNITVTVNAALPTGNLPPVARTENDITITLPTNSTQLHGKTSSDPDGVIASYQWTQVSGPGQAVITSGTTSVATVSDLTTGIYTFELKVTDDDGAIATKSIKVTVNNKPGQGAVMNIYPNPTGGLLNIQYVSNTNGKYKVMIYDANRRLVRNEVINKTQVSMTMTIDVSKLERGIYIIQFVSSEKEMTAMQFVKM